MKIEINIICPGCEKQMELKQYYLYDSNPTTFTIIPCKCGIDYKKYIRILKAIEKDQSRRTKLPRTPVFGDHLQATR